jgi:PD-(D/E)XK endonuclease
MARVAQSAEQAAFNRQAVGSSPTPRMHARPHPKPIGEASEVEVIAALHRAGYVVLLAPFTDNQRYDCVIDDGTRLLRVQIKTGRVVSGAVAFSVRSTDWYRRRTHRTYHGEADLFAVYCPDTAAVYLIPVDACGRRQTRLRLVAARNGQVSRVRWAHDYELRPTACIAVASDAPHPRAARSSKRRRRSSMLA